MRLPALLLFVVCSSAYAQTPAAKSTAAAAAVKEPALVWHAVGTGSWDVEGRAWAAEPRKRYFDRLPAAAEGKVPDAVWNLSRDSAGMVARFKTDADTIWVDYTLLTARTNMAHMPATGVRGMEVRARFPASRPARARRAAHRPAPRHARIRRLSAALQRHRKTVPWRACRLRF